VNVLHRLSFDAVKNGSELAFLEKNDIQFRFHATSAYPGRDDAEGFVTITISENHPSWILLQHLAAKIESVDLITTEFTLQECTQASRLAVYPQWHHGYPMPDMDNGYIEATYDTRQGCVACGVGWEQNAPFRMKSEPKWGRRQILQLNWVFDEYFVTPTAYEAVFKQFGIPCREVLHHKTGKPLTSVVQLVVESVDEVHLNINRSPDEICKVCGRGKYHAHTRGFFPKLTTAPKAHMLKPQEYFGSGGSAWRPVIVSNTLYSAMSGFKMNEVNYYPLAE
jgi:hypothetical protein